MQNKSQAYFIDRSLFYASKTIVDQGVKGQWDYHLTPVYVICFMNFDVDENTPKKFRTDVVLECLYKFEFEVKNLRQFIVYNEDQSITVNHIMPHFLSVAIGTMRGILVVKTAGTNCSKYPLPMINVNQLNVNLSNKE